MSQSCGLGLCNTQNKFLTRLAKVIGPFFALPWRVVGWYQVHYQGSQDSSGESVLSHHLFIFRVVTFHILGVFGLGTIWIIAHTVIIHITKDTATFLETDFFFAPAVVVGSFDCCSIVAEGDIPKNSKTGHSIARSEQTCVESIFCARQHDDDPKRLSLSLTPKLCLFDVKCLFTSLMVKLDKQMWLKFAETC